MAIVIPHLFLPLDSHPAKEIDFFTFLISFSSAQTQTYHQDDSSMSLNTTSSSKHPIISTSTTRRPTETTSAVKSVIHQYLLEEHTDGESNTELSLLDAETIVLHQEHTSRLDIPGGSTATSRGNLFLTNYRLIYRYVTQRCVMC